MLCILFCLNMDPTAAPVVVNSYAIECRIFRISRRDTDESQRQMAQENARCRAARDKAQKK